jgi:sulfate permease, SulP family
MGDAFDPAARKADRAWLSSFRDYDVRFLPGDLAAGLSLAAIAIPSQMATAQIGGFPPQMGFFAFLAGALGFAAFGANRFLCSCADSTIMPIFAGSLALMAATGTKDYALFAAALALMVGIALVLAGLFRLGRVGDLLSIPVTIGFLIGIAVHILISQISDILGTAVMSVRAANPFTLSIAAGEFALLVVAGRINPRIPAALLGLTAATCAVFFLRLEGRGVAVLGTISRALPMPGIPLVSTGDLASLVPLTLIVTIIIMVQTAATARSYPSDPYEPPDLDRDIVGVGAGCILAGFFGAFPVDASPPSTEIVRASGGRSQIACLTAAAILLFLLFCGEVLLRHVPRAALSGVLLYVAFKLIRFDQIAVIYRQSFPEFLLIVATTAAIIFLPIGVGVAIGIGLSLLHGIWSTASGKVTAFERVPGTSVWWPPMPNQKGEALASVAVLSFDAPLSFLNAERFRREFDAALPETPLKLVVLEAANISQIDFTAAETLREIIRACRARGTDFAIARLESVRAQEAVRRFGLDDLLAQDHVFRSVEEAVRTLAPDAPVS